MQMKGLPFLHKKQSGIPGIKLLIVNCENQDCACVLVIRMIIFYAVDRPSCFYKLSFIKKSTRDKCFSTL